MNLIVNDIYQLTNDGEEQQVLNELLATAILIRNICNFDFWFRTFCLLIKSSVFLHHWVKIDKKI